MSNKVTQYIEEHKEAFFAQKLTENRETLNATKKDAGSASNSSSERSSV